MRRITAAFVAVLSLHGCAVPSSRRLDSGSGSFSKQILDGTDAKDVTIAVLPFKTGGQPTELGRVLAESVSGDIIKSRRFITLDRANFCALLDEMQLGLLGFADGATAQRIGKLTGAEFVLVGTLDRVSPAEILMQGRLLKTETGQVVASARTYLKSSPDLEAMLGREVSEQPCGQTLRKPSPDPEPIEETESTSGWEPVAVLPHERVNAFLSFGGHLYAGVGSPRPGDGAVYRQSGKDWERVLTTDMVEIYALGTFDGKLFAAGGSGGYDTIGASIFVFDGRSWRKSGTLNCHNINALLEFKGRFYAACGHNGARLFALEKGTWRPVKTFTEESYYIDSLFVHRGLLYVGLSGPVDRHMTVHVFDGRRWSTAGELPAYSVAGFAEYRGDLFAFTVGPGRVYVRKRDKWSLALDMPDTYGPYGGIKHQGELFVATHGKAGVDDHGKVYKFDGRAWKVDFISDDPALHRFGVHSGELYTGTAGRFRVSRCKILKYVKAR